MLANRRVERGTDANGAAVRVARLAEDVRKQLGGESARRWGPSGGWKDTHTITTCYMKPDEVTQRAALNLRKSERVSGV